MKNNEYYVFSSTLIITKEAAKTNIKTAYNIKIFSLLYKTSAES